MKKIKHLSPSMLQTWCASPALTVLEKMLGHRQPGNAPMHRGTAVEDGVTAGLMNPVAPMEECVDVALKKYDTITALMGDKRREEYRATIPEMVKTALEELRPYGIPSHTQRLIEWKAEGLTRPIIGYLDYYWDQHNITVDLKTTEKQPSAVKIPHARQVAFYSGGGNADARVCYVTPKKRATYQVDNIDAHRNSLHQIALRCEAWLDQSDDVEFFLAKTAPDLESFYWSGPAMRQLAFEHWKI